jgi:hypothetical protein
MRRVLLAPSPTGSLELRMPKHYVQLDVARIRRLAVEAIAALPDEELAAGVGVGAELVPALRGARDLNEAHDYATQILEPEPIRLEEDADGSEGRPGP